MIGLFDSGHGGLTVMQAVATRFPTQPLVYLGDHANAPYGDKSGPEIVAHTQAAVEALFAKGCTLVLIACNTATAVAARTLQHTWLPAHAPHNRILGVIAPVVEAATQTPWSIHEPQFPQKYNTDTFALFATTATVNSGVFGTEIHKRCPHAKVVAQACPRLVPLIESGAPATVLQAEVTTYVQTLLSQVNTPPEWAILGCTHYPLIAPMFRAALPPQTRIMDQPTATANALDDYLSRHPEYLAPATPNAPRTYLTTGNTAEVSRIASQLLGYPITFAAL